MRHRDGPGVACKGGARGRVGGHGRRGAGPQTRESGGPASRGQARATGRAVFGPRITVLTPHPRVARRALRRRRLPRADPAAMPEADVPAERDHPETAARLARAHRHPRRPPRAAAAQGQGPMAAHGLSPAGSAAVPRPARRLWSRLRPRDWGGAHAAAALRRGAGRLHVVRCAGCSPPCLHSRCPASLSWEAGPQSCLSTPAHAPAPFEQECVVTFRASAARSHRWPWTAGRAGVGAGEAGAWGTGRGARERRGDWHPRARGAPLFNGGGRLPFPGAG